MTTSLLFSASLATYAPGRRDMSVRHDQALDMRPRRTDMRIAGMYRLAGTTAVAGSPDVPVARLVRLYHSRFASFCARETLSAADGSWSFTCLDRGPWTVIAFDHTGEYNAVVAANILGEPM